MPFPVSYRGKLEFPLSGDPERAIDRFYEDASVGLAKRGLVSVDSELVIDALDGKLVVEYTLKFRQILSIITALVVSSFLLYLLSWDLFLPSGPTRAVSAQHSGIAINPTLSDLFTVMVAAWMGLFGGAYLMSVVRFRALLRETWKGLKPGVEPERNV
jgi:hypothetical protein